jgi:hypothetical protein
MTADVAGRLQQYAHNLVADHLKAEYEYQINRWASTIDHMVDAHQAATERQQKVFEVAHRAILKTKQKQQVQAEIWMTVFTILSGPGVSWAAGAVQHTLYPKFGPKVKTRIADAFGKYEYTTREDRERNWGKLFGDMSKGVAEFGIDRTLKPDAPRPGSDVQNLMARITQASNLLSFGTNLKDALRQQAELTIKAIMSLAMKINESSDYGPACLQRLERLDPRMKRASAAEREARAKAMIVNDIDRQRGKWADEWFYYGREPHPTRQPTLIDAVELELWAFWILQEQFKIETVNIQSGDKVTNEPHVIGKSGFDLTYAPPVLERLGDYDVVVGQNQKQRDQQLQRGVEEDSPNDRPLMEVYPTLGDKEIKLLENWATKHNPNAGANLRTYKRTLGSILDVHKA